MGSAFQNPERAVDGSLASFSNPRGLRQNRACRSTSLLLYDTVCDRQLCFSLNSFQRFLLSLSEIKGKVKGEVVLQGSSWWGSHGKHTSSGSNHVNVWQYRLTSRNKWFNVLQSPKTFFHQIYMGQAPCVSGTKQMVFKSAHFVALYLSIFFVQQGNTCFIFPT